MTECDVFHSGFHFRNKQGVLKADQNKKGFQDTFKTWKMHHSANVFICCVSISGVSFMTRVTRHYSAKFQP